MQSSSNINLDSIIAIFTLCFLCTCIDFHTKPFDHKFRVMAYLEDVKKHRILGFEGINLRFRCISRSHYLRTPKLGKMILCSFYC